MSTLRGVLELLDSHGALVARVRLDQLPVVIGRGNDVDVHVDDPYMDATHVRLVEEEGRIIAEDAGSVNGLRANGQNARVERVPLERGTTLHAGRTTIRFIEPGEGVPPARRDRGAVWNAPLAKPSLLTPRWVRAGAMAGCLALWVAYQAATIFERDVGTKITGGAFAVAFMVLFWAGAWSIGAQLARHPALLSYHVAITCLAASAVGAAVFAEEWFEFLWTSGDSAVVTVPLVFAIVTGALYAHLGLASSLRRLWRVVIAVAIPVGIVALAMISVSNDEEKFSTKMDYETQLKPYPAARRIPAEEIDAFAKSLRELRVKLDKEYGDTVEKKK